MSDVTSLRAVGAASLPVGLTAPMGHIVWLDTCESSVVDLVQTIQDCLPTERLTVAAVWPEGAADDPTRAEKARLMTEVATGVVQSLQFELGVEGTTTNVVVVNSGQVQDLQTTVDYFHGPDGGFVAGCTFDLRHQGAGA
jgi:hypothetical protein